MYRAVVQICIPLFSSFMFSNFLQVVRSGRRIKVSIFDIVVGDVVPLKIGDQVMKISHSLSFLISPLQ